MPKAWSSRDERLYEHVRDTYREQGRSEDKAEELAARTVNKHRHDEGRTKEQRASRSRGGSHDDGPTRDELYQEARRLGIDGRSRMDKQELKRAVGRERH